MYFEDSVRDPHPIPWGVLALSHLWNRQPAKMRLVDLLSTSSRVAFLRFIRDGSSQRKILCLSHGMSSSFRRNGVRGYSESRRFHIDVETVSATPRPSQFKPKCSSLNRTCHCAEQGGPTRGPRRLFLPHPNHCTSRLTYIKKKKSQF